MIHNASSRRLRTCSYRRGAAAGPEGVTQAYAEEHGPPHEPFVAVVIGDGLRFARLVPTEVGRIGEDEVHRDGLHLAHHLDTVAMLDALRPANWIIFG